MKLFVYTRKNVNNLSVEEQLQLCRQYAEEHGHTIVSEYIERSNSKYTSYRIFEDDSYAPKAFEQEGVVLK